MARGGKRPGSGAKKGKKTAKVIEREEVLRQWREKAAERAMFLLDKQTHLAAGQTFLYRIDKERIGRNIYRNKKPVLVESEFEIRQYLDDLVSGKIHGDSEDDSDPSASFYFMTAKEPSNQAIDSMMDRTFGRAKQGELDVNLRTPQPIRPVPKDDKSNKK